MRSENHKIEDRLLLKRAIEESCPKALDEIYQKYRPFIAKYIAQKVRFQDEGQDLVQSVFLRLCQGNCKYSGDSDVQGYLCGIAKNVLRDHFKAKSRQIKSVSLDDIEIDGDLLVIDSHAEDPLENLQKQEIQQIIKEAIANLPGKSRQAIELVYLVGINISEAAKKLGCNSKVLRDRLHRGVLLLRAELSICLKKCNT